MANFIRNFLLPFGIFWLLIFLYHPPSALELLKILLQGVVFVGSWWGGLLYFKSIIPKFMDGIGLFLWILIGPSIGIGLMGLVEKLFP